MTEEKQEKGKEKERYELVQVTTQTDLAVKDNETGELYDSLSLLVKISNTLDRVEKGVIG